jgi:RNA recognition motif-containing protein
MNIYVGNLPYTMSNQELKDMFSPFGQVEDAYIISDKDTKRSKGFGFVNMPTASEATKAIEELNGSEINGRGLRVNEAKPRA